MATNPVSSPTKAATPIAKPLKTKTTVDAQKPGKAGAGVSEGVGAGKESVKKSLVSTAPSPAGTAALAKLVSERSTSDPKPRRKPRKLKKNGPLDPTSDTASISSVPADTTQDPAAELDALKSRVRGLEAKVEELYSNTSTRPQSSRSPRRRGKGRKVSSLTQAPTLNTLPGMSKDQAANRRNEVKEEEADEELVRLEGELEVARQDLDSYPYRSYPHRTASQDSDQNDIEEIPRDSGERTMMQGNKQVTLSGSYRIPIPTNVSMDDVKNIKSGVSAAQNVAKTFLEQRRAAAALRAEQSAASSSSKTTTATTTARHSASGSSSTRAESGGAMGRDICVGEGNSEDKQSWGDWIGGYSLAITRAVKSIEHEAAMESRRGDFGTASQTRSDRTSAAPSMKKNAEKRPPAKAKLSSEQVHGLM
ncbi:hypothetical protein T440DRAFT_467803, partial [Plenodomus tracheiphilus IPT5]